MSIPLNCRKLSCGTGSAIQKEHPMAFEAWIGCKSSITSIPRHVAISLASANVMVTKI